MKKRNLFVLVFSICLVLILAACSGATPAPTPTPTPGPTPKPAPSGPIELKVATWFPPPSGQAKTLEAFCQDVEAQTGGQIKMEYFPGGTLLDRGKMHQGVIDGVADIGYDAIHYTAGRFLVTEVITSTLGWPSAWVGAHVANDFYNKYKPAEWNDVKMIWLHANEPKVIYSKKPIRTLEDLKGLTIRAPGSPGDIISALGATPAPTPTGEMADAIAKGTLDGAFLPLETIKTFKTAEVIDYITMCWNIGSTDCFYLVMNKDVYASLDAMPEAKATFDRLCGQYFESFAGLMWNSIDFPGLAEAQKFNVEVIDLAPAEAAKWEAAAAPAVDKYIKKMVDAGTPEAEVKGWIEYLNERIDYWTQKQIEYKVQSLTGPEEMRPK